MKKRISWIDNARGFAIISVIVIHELKVTSIYDSEYIVYNCLTCFNMALFFFLSGVLYHVPSNARKFVISKAKKLLIPLLAFSVVLFCYNLVVSLLNGNVQSYICEIISADTILVTPNSHLIEYWFFPCLFVVEVLMCLISTCVGGLYAEWVLLSVLCVTSRVLYAKSIVLPLECREAMFLIVFYAAGYYCKDICSSKYLLAEGSGFVALYLIWYIGKGSAVSVYKSDFGIVFGSEIIGTVMTTIIGVVGSLFIVSLCKNYVNQYNWLTTIGKNSMYIYGTHYVILDLFVRKIYSKFIINGIVLNLFQKWIFNIVTIALVIMITNVLAEIITKYIGKVHAK